MSAKEKEQLGAELAILKDLKHPNIVAYYEKEHLKASMDVHLYMEYCGNGDLGRIIRNLKAKRQYAEESFVWSILSQTVSALFRCHYGVDPPEPGSNFMGLANITSPKSGKPTVLHRDLKPENSTYTLSSVKRLTDLDVLTSVSLPWERQLRQAR
jgi:NIMA (never in mitosis gene a)-related kinase